MNSYLSRRLANRGQGLGEVFLVILAVVVITMVASAIYNLFYGFFGEYKDIYREGQIYSEYNPFKNELDLSHNSGPSKPGKLVFVEFNSDDESMYVHSDDYDYYIDNSLIAKTPEEVKYVVYTDDRVAEVGTYTFGTKAYGCYSTAVIVDWDTKQVIAQSERFVGSDPRRVKIHISLARLA